MTQLKPNRWLPLGNFMFAGLEQQAITKALFPHALGGVTGHIHMKSMKLESV